MIILSLIFHFFFSQFGQWTKTIRYLPFAAYSGISLSYESTSRKRKGALLVFSHTTASSPRTVTNLASSPPYRKLKPSTELNQNLRAWSLRCLRTPHILLLTCPPALLVALRWLLVAPVRRVSRCRGKRAPCALPSLWCTNARAVII